MKRPVLIVAGMAICVPAFAHVRLAVREAPAGSTYHAVFQVAHGCGGAATTAIRVTLPEGIMSADPEPKRGWTVTIAHQALALPVQNEGRTITQRVNSVAWQEGSLPDGQAAEFTLVVRLPADQGRVSFPVIQTCGAEEVRWEGEPASDASEQAPPHPAPSVALLRKTG